MVFGCENEGLVPGVCFNDGVTLTGEVLGHDSAYASVVVAYQDCSFATLNQGGRQSGVRRDVGGPGSAWKHDIQGRANAEVALRPNGSTMLLDNAAADSKTKTCSTLLASIGGFYL